ncbi:MAG: hypothetical protein JXN61_01045 [Sedimentisphaerales bacterium]|nr:hypothetical protein [Sedimentisphaerales bacterium]
MDRRETDYIRSPWRSGYIMLLSLLIVVLIGLVIYVVMTGEGIDLTTGEKDTSPPWRQWTKNLIELKKKPIGTPSPDQPQLAGALQFMTDAWEDQQKRGSIQLAILPDGTIEGQWSGQYWISKTLDHQVMAASFKGNIVPERIYSDENGEDTTKLYFIGHGGFSILETNSETSRVRNVMGDLYITGWLDGGNNAAGKITITSDERRFRAYTW